MVDTGILKTGWLEVIAGPMFSGKTEEMIRRMRRAKIAKRKLLVFKPAMDIRFAGEMVVSHSKNEVPAIPVQNAQDILDKVGPTAEVIGIDEVQFFGPEIVDVCRVLVKRGVRVIVSGLDLDFKAQPFGSMCTLLALGDSVDKLNSVCSVCGNPATRSQRLTDTEAVVELGASVQYEARCHAHYIQPEN